MVVPIKGALEPPLGPGPALPAQSHCKTGAMAARLPGTAEQARSRSHRLALIRIKLLGDLYSRWPSGTAIVEHGPDGTVDQHEALIVG